MAVAHSGQQLRSPRLLVLGSVAVVAFAGGGGGARGTFRRQIAYILLQ